VDINETEKEIQKAGVPVTAGWGWAIDVLHTDCWTMVYAPGTKVRLVTFNYRSFEQNPSLRHLQLAEGICRIINGKRSDPRCQLPIDCDARETEVRVQHFFRPDFHLILPPTIVFLTNKSFSTEMWRYMNSVCLLRNAIPKSSPFITNHLNYLHTLTYQPTCTPSDRLLFENQTLPYTFNKLPHYYGTRMFITMLTIVGHLSSYYATLFQSTPSKLIPHPV
jgi:hypothetical protein